GLPPSITTASEPFSILTRLGPRSRYFACTRSRQISGLRSICPSAEMHLYDRPMSCPFIIGLASTGMIECWVPLTITPLLHHFSPILLPAKVPSFPTPADRLRKK